MTTTFAHLGLPDSLVRALDRSGIAAPFPVQAATIPDALAGRDIAAGAPTGSGKTLAFGLPLLARIGRARRNQPRALILAPTRELAEQITGDLAPFAAAARRSVLAVYGGVGYGPQIRGLARGADVLAATPGRLEDLIERRAVDLGGIEVVVVDEADRMADMGFLPPVRRILDRTPAGRQTLLFSATLDGDVAVLVDTYQRDPVRREVDPVEEEASQVAHHFWLVEHHERVRHTADVVGVVGRSIVFTRTRRGADRLARQLGTLGVEAVALHGGRSQSQRDRALRAFASGRTPALIATDVAARGIHVEAVASVIHFDPARDHKDYLHRSGRTARAGATGTVVSMVTGEQQSSIRRIQRGLGMREPIGRPHPEALRPGEPPAAEPARRGPVRHRPAARSTTRSDDRARADGGRQSIYVANLPWAATGEDLDALFGRYGDVHASTVIMDRRTGRSRGFGFVDMPATAARTAADELHGSLLGGRDLTVRFAPPKRGRR
jgi:superfamily II DNA/RNA helicase